MKWQHSRTGWALLSAYLVLAVAAWYEALTCTGWVCDLAAIPAIFPLGFPIAWFTDWIDALFHIPGHVPTFHLRNWYFIIPTVIANSVFYYWLGMMLGRLATRVRQRSRSES